MTGTTAGMRLRKAGTLILAFAAVTATLAIGAFAPHAHAATAEGITITAGENMTLGGRTFNVYLIGTYTDIVQSHNKVTSFNVVGTTASNTWAKDAIAKVNEQTTDTSKRISVPTGYDEAGAIAKVSDAGTLRKLAQALAASKSIPAAAAADRKSDTGTLNINVPDGLYLVTDSKGLPMILGTSFAGVNLDGQTMGQLVVKNKAVELTKKILVDNKEADAGSVTVGQNATYRLRFTTPNAGNDGTKTTGRIVDTPTGQTYVDGSARAALSDGTDVTGLIDVVKGAGTLPKSADIPNQKDLTVPAGGVGFNVTRLIAAHPNKAVTITLSMTVTSTADEQHPQAADGYFDYYDGATPPDPNQPPTHTSVQVTTYGFTLKKVSQADKTQLVNNAGFKIQDKKTGKWLSWDAANNQWVAKDSEADAAVLLTGDSNHDGTVDATDDAAKKGLIVFTGLAAGDYLVKETQAPAGFTSAAAAMPSFTATVGTQNSFTGSGLTAELITPDGQNVTVANVDSLLNLPQTGGVLTLGAWLLIGGLLVACAMTTGVFGVKRRMMARKA